ncbi:hypothetical protein Plhal710r2_c007g0033041 [Plasmopara halstedii]
MLALALLGYQITPSITEPHARSVSLFFNLTSVCLSDLFANVVDFLRSARS